MTTLEPAEVEVRSAATVMIVRDTDRGPEVFMVRRNPDSAFVGGAYVFPGGAVDDHDRLDPGVEQVTSGLTDLAASSWLGLDAGGLAFWVAAIRECFEEAGLLLAYGPDGTVMRFDDPSTEARFTAHRRAVDAGEVRLVEVCEQERLVLACDAIHYFSHWVTPVGPPRRYDTRFFLARAPELQVGVHDDREIVANVWLRPEEALDRWADGRLQMIQPTVRNLEAIARFDSVDAVMAATAAPSGEAASAPRLFQEDGGVRVLLPGDPDHPDAPAPHGGHP